MVPTPPRLTTLASGAVEDICLELLGIPSTTGEEALLVDAIERELARLPVRRERIGDTLIVRTGSGPPGLAMVGHADTVPPSSQDPPRRTGRRLVGRGAADMKAGLAVMLALLRRFAPAGPPVSFAFSDGEEGPYERNGLRRALGTSSLFGRPALTVALEPTAGRAELGAVGILDGTLVVQGRASHAARPWQGENALHRALPALSALAGAGQRTVQVDGLPFVETVQLTGVRGGVARNVLPDRVEATVNARIAPGRSLAEAKRDLERLAGDAGRLGWVSEAPPARTHRSHPAVARFLDIAAVAAAPKQGWTDVATIAAHGLVAVNYGPGDPAQAHSAGEWVDIEDLHRCERTLARVVARWGGLT